MVGSETALGFFADECSIGLGRLIKRRRRDVSVLLHPGHKELPEVPSGTHDTAWLEAVGNRQLIVISHDTGLLLNSSEQDAWSDYCVRGFIVTSNGSVETDYGVLAAHWNRMAKIIGEFGSGPWACRVSRSGVRRANLWPRGNEE